MKRFALLLAFTAACNCEGPQAATSTRAQAPAGAIDLDPSPDVVHIALRAAEHHGDAFHYAYNEQNPGPTIHAKLGDELIVDLDNQLPFPTSIHWHGVKVPWEMDGASWMQEPVASGATFTYRFTLRQTGTFWYHPHFDTDGQVDGGLYGLLVVEDPSEPRADEEWELVFDTEHEAHRHSSASGHAQHLDHEVWLVNGTRTPTITARGGTRVRARLLNASNASYLALRAPNLRVIAGDQGLLPAPRSPERLVLAPGDRAELELDLGEDDLSFTTDPYTLNGGDALGDPKELLRVALTDRAPAPAPIAWPERDPTPSADPGYAAVVYAFAGSDRTENGYINGERFPNITVEELALGSTAVLEIRNLSPTEHPFHLHGVDFEVLSVNGVPPAAKTVEDTFNLKIRDRLRVLVHADNPGEWMAHCHLLPHAEHGMMTVLRIR